MVQPHLIGRRRLAARIRHLREAARMTQEQLATAAGIGRVTLVRIEHGEPQMTLEELRQALGEQLGDVSLGEWIEKEREAGL